jgi:hypothetical protein
MGSQHVWSSLDDFEEMVSYWPEKFCLVIHTRSNIHRRMDYYLKSLIKTGKIYISTQPVDREDVTALVSSADFCLAPYKLFPDTWFTLKNLYHLGLASGKTSHYAMCGLPILARSLPVYEREFEEFECGKVYTRLSETGQLLEEMDAHYDHFSAEAVRFYQERLDPFLGIERFCDRLLEMS